MRQRFKAQKNEIKLLSSQPLQNRKENVMVVNISINELLRKAFNEFSVVNNVQ
jgi:hypothetical protein